MSADLSLHQIGHPARFIDRDLATEVEGALWSYGPLRGSLARLSVKTDDGHVTISGNVRTGAMRALAGRLALGLPSVEAVENQLVVDTDLESGVAVALATDPDSRLLTDTLHVKAVLGTVLLAGTIHAANSTTGNALKDRAQALASAVPGVRRVINRIAVAPAN